MKGRNSWRNQDTISSNELQGGTVSGRTRGKSRAFRNIIRKERLKDVSEGEITEFKVI